MRVLPKLIGFVLLTLLMRAAAAWGSVGNLTSGTSPSATLSITFVPSPPPPAGQPAKGLFYPAGPSGLEPSITPLVQRYLFPKYTHVDVGPPVPLYSFQNPLGPADVVPPNLPNFDAQATLWQYQYPLRSGGQRVGTIHVFADRNATNYGSVSISLVAATATPAQADEFALLDRAAATAQVKAGSYEARQVQFFWRGAKTDVFWLKSAPGGADLLVDLSGTLYSVPDYWAMLLAKVTRAAQAGAAQTARLAAQAAENRRKATDGEDTATIRLKALQAALETILTAMKTAAASAPSADFSEPLADLARAQGDVTHALGYVAAHPESNVLTPTEVTNARSAWSSDVVVSNQRDDLVFVIVSNGLTSSLNEFIGKVVAGRPIIGEMGGYRDTILREIGTATNHYARVVNNRTPTTRGALPARPSVATPSPEANRPAQSGSVSGRVVFRRPVQRPAGTAGPPNTDTSPVPAAFQMITFVPAASSYYPVVGSPYSAHGQTEDELPGTVTDADGNFVIRNLPAGNYSIGVWRQSRINVEVKEGADTQLTTPLVLSTATGGFG